MIERKRRCAQSIAAIHDTTHDNFGFEGGDMANVGPNRLDMSGLKDFALYCFGVLLLSPILLGGCDLSRTISSNTMAVRDTTSAMASMKGSIDKAGSAIQTITPELQKVEALKGPLSDAAALKETLEGLARQLDQLRALQQTLSDVAKLAPGLGEVATLRGPLREVSALQHELQIVGDLHDPVVALNEQLASIVALDRTLRQVADLHDPLIEVSHLNDALGRTANLARPLGQLSDLADQGTRYLWLFAGGFFVLCTSAMTLGTFIGVRIGLKQRSSA
jgi:hypothetical protein